MARRFVISVAALATPIALLSGCNSNNQAEQQTTTTTTTTPTTTAPAGVERLTAQLKTADGTPVADATFDFAGGIATVTVQTTRNGVLRPGFHGMHIHSVGKCEPNSVPPTGGQPGNFLSAGGHFQVPGHSGHPASGDLTALAVGSDGSARLVTTTDAVTAQALLAGQKTALIIHEDEDNFAHIPDRYSQPNGAHGPDEETLATGDAGARVACGVIDSQSATATTTTTTTTTPATVTETTVISPTTVVPPPAGTTPTETTPVTTTPATTVPTTTSPTTTTTTRPPG